MSVYETSITNPKKQLEFYKDLSEQLEKDNQELKKQLEYLHGEEYLNQLRFERNMLQDVVDKMEVSKEDKMFIDMTRRNTELLEENQGLKEQLEVGKEQYNDLVEEKENLQEQLSNSHQIEVQQKEFIKWLEKETKIIENKLNKYNELVKQGKETDIEYYLSIIDERIFDIYGKILSKYKEIIGCKE